MPKKKVKKEKEKIITVHIRIPKSLVDAVDKRAKEWGIDDRTTYTKFLYKKDIREGEDK